MWRPKLTLCILIAPFLGAGYCEAGEDYLRYDIPKEAVQRGPLRKQEPNTYYYVYKLGSTVVARETYKDSVKVQLELFSKPRVKHGIQKTWHDSGGLSSETPYDNGLVDGICRRWDESGRVIAEYLATRGEGIGRFYYSSGQLAQVTPFNRAGNHGQVLTYHPNGRLSTIGNFVNGEVSGAFFTFSDTGELIKITIAASSGAVLVDLRPGESDIAWMLNEKEVQEEEYRLAASTDASVPPLYATPEEYRKHYYTDEIRSLVKALEKTVKVKIPLQFDSKGEPIPSGIQ